MEAYINEIERKAGRAALATATTARDRAALAWTHVRLARRHERGLLVIHHDAQEVARAGAALYERERDAERGPTRLTPRIRRFQARERTTWGKRTARLP